MTKNKREDTQRGGEEEKRNEREQRKTSWLIFFLWGLIDWLIFLCRICAFVLDLCVCIRFSSPSFLFQIKLSGFNICVPFASQQWINALKISLISEVNIVNWLQLISWMQCIWYGFMGYHLSSFIYPNVDGIFIQWVYEILNDIDVSTNGRETHTHTHTNREKWIYVAQSTTQNLIYEVYSIYYNI